MRKIPLQATNKRITNQRNELPKRVLRFRIRNTNGKHTIDIPMVAVVVVVVVVERAKERNVS